LVLEVFGRGDGGDSPQCGEMSEGQRGPPPSAEPFLRKVSPINTYSFPISVPPLSAAFFITELKQVGKL
ncbi:MAG: hypothetical protein J6L05_03025, partial [Ruminococcus sp.]|nr:hypothetical protein [Ruminococcus sp.]